MRRKRLYVVGRIQRHSSCQRARSPSCPRFRKWRWSSSRSRLDNVQSSNRGSKITKARLISLNETWYAFLCAFRSLLLSSLMRMPLDWCSPENDPFQRRARSSACWKRPRQYRCGSCSTGPEGPSAGRDRTAQQRLETIRRRT